ncbi:MAG: hypothetical protein WCO93_06580, partial [bacterium]
RLNENPKVTASNFAILQKEIPMLTGEAGFGDCQQLGSLTPGAFTDQVAEDTKMFLDSLSRYYSQKLGNVSGRRDRAYESMVARMGEEGVFRFRQDYYNDNLADLVLNKSAENKIIEGKGLLIRKKDPIFMMPESNTGNTHFYAPVKVLFGWQIDTFWFNFCVIWFMSVILYFTLLYDVIRRIIGYFERMKFRKV